MCNNQNQQNNRSSNQRNNQQNNQNQQNSQNRQGRQQQGAEVTVTCEGADEDAAAEAMEKFFKENL